jgi:hypothetical protein
MGNWIDLGGFIFSLLSAAFVLWAIIRAWTRPRPAENTQPAPASAELPPLDLPGPARWLIDLIKRPFMVYDDQLVMPSDRARDDAGAAGAGQVRHRGAAPVSVSAEPNTDETEQVPGASGASTLDTSARDIMRASVIAELLDSGLLTNRDKAICQIFHCSKAASTRPDAPFQVALRLVEQHRAKRKPEYVGDLIERVHREVAAEQR